MTQITEDFVSLETAKLLKEKGFDWCESPFYSEQDRDEWRQNNSYTIPNMEYNPDLPFDSEELTMVAPHVSIQMAMKWLREVYHIFITIEIKGDPRKEDFIYYKWSVAKYYSIAIDRIDNNLTHPEDYWIAPLEEEETYERTCEAAIKFCIENLI